MAKKTFKDDTSHLDRFFSETQKKHGTHKPHIEKLKPYRINLKLKGEYKEYLDRVSWESHKSITQYINDLIEADRVAQDTENIQDT